MPDKKKTKDELIVELDNARRLLIEKEEELTAKAARQFESVRDQPRILDAFFDNTITPLAVLDRDFNFIMVNPAYARAGNLEISDFDDKNLLDLYPSYAIKMFKEVVATKRSYQAMARPFKFPGQPERETTYWDWTLVPILDRDGGVDLLVFSLVEVTKRKRAEIALTESNALLNALGDAQTSYISDTSPNELFDNLLGELLKITKSEYGFIGQTLTNEKGEPYLKNFATTNIAWNKETSTFYEKHKDEGLEFTNMESLFGLVITTGEPIISNDAPSDKRGCGIPEGHPPLNSFLGLPCYAKNKLVGMVAIANRPGGYSEEIIDLLKPLLSTTANIIEAFRNDIIRKETEETLKKTEERFKKAQEIAHVGTWDWDPNSGALLWTDEIYKILGYSPDKIKASYELFLERVHPGDRKQLKAAVTDALENRNSYNIDCRIVRQDGSTVDANAQGDVYFDHDGKPVRMLGLLQDITERKLAGEALEESERFLSIAQAIAHLGHWKLDPATNEVTGSDELFRIFGLNRNEASLEAFVKVVHREDRDLIDSTIQKGNTEGEDWDMEHRLTMKDGTEKTIHTIGNAITDETGQTVELIGTVQDITERKVNEERLKSERKRLFSILDSFPGFVYLQADDHTIAFANKRFIDHYGDPTGKSCHELIWDREKPCEDCRTFEVFKTKEPLEWISDHPKQESVYQVYDHPFIDIDGRFLVLELSIDITKRRKAEEALAVHTGRLKRLSELSMALSGDPSEVFESVIKMIGELLDVRVVALSEIRGDQLYFLTVYVDGDTTANAGQCDLDITPCSTVVDSKDLRIYDHVMDKFPQATFLKNYNAYSYCGFPSLNSEGEVIAVTCLLDDKPHEFSDEDQRLLRIFGQRIAMELERSKVIADHLKMQKLESIGVLAGGIAHDFNNLLTGILGNVSFSMMDLDPKDNIYARLKEAESASLIARDLTQQLLTFSKGGEPVMETHTIESLVKKPAQLALRGSINKCEFAFSKDLPCVQADIAQISQVINNLAINANHAMEDGGIIRISAEKARVTEKDKLPVKNGEYVLIQVKDKGTGIPAKLIPKVFDPYFTTKEKGSGLGLASVYSIILKHGGHIELKSKIDVGTTFSIYLPATKETSVHVNEEKVEIMRGQGKVLIMDDEEIIRELLSEFLLQLGYEAVSVNDGEEAIKVYTEAAKNNKPFKAVIMDLTIQGGMGGQETIKLLLKEYPKAKAIVSSGYSNDPVISNYREYGFSGYLNKPYKVLLLSKVLCDVISGK